MARYFLEVMYDGSALHGSQLQGETPTVQLAINLALSTLLRKEIETFGASRTDEGVHAMGNYYHFDLEEPLHPQFKYRLNAILPDIVAVRRLFVTNDPNMNARFEAISRRYRYRIYHTKDPFQLHRALFFPFTIDIEVLHQTAAIIKEYEHFESFAKRNSQNKTFICRIQQSYWEQKEGELHYVVEANRFLRGMVRGLVGTQLQIARGRGTVDDFRKIIEANDCTQADFSVTGNGLYLEKITYPENSLTEIFDIR